MAQAVQITAVCMVAAILALLLRGNNPETALCLSLSAVIVSLLFLSDGLRTTVEYLSALASRAGVSDELLIPLYKTLGIALVVRIGSSLCRDAGESALATAVETAGTVCALVTALPLFDKVLDLLSRWI